MQMTLMNRTLPWALAVVVAVIALAEKRGRQAPRIMGAPTWACHLDSKRPNQNKPAKIERALPPSRGGVYLQN